MSWHRIEIVGTVSATAIALFSLFDKDFRSALGWGIVALYQADRVANRRGRFEDTA